MGFWGIDFLLTWNCKHIANAESVKEIGMLCKAEGYEAPIICIKDDLAAEFNYDLREMLKNAIQKQKESERRIVNLSKKKILREVGKSNEGVE